MNSLNKVPFVDLQTDYQVLKPEIDAAIQRVLDTSAYILGPDVSAFEAAFADYCQVEHAVGVNSGYSALELMLRAYDIGPGDEVITQANTFIATILPIVNVGATPVLVDIEPHYYNLDPHQLESAITPATRAIMPVHLYGHPADMTAILEIARRHNLLVFEDSAQAHGATINGRRAGGFGDAAAFSFYPAKNLGAFGDAGAFTTDDADAAEKVRLLRNLGQPVKYIHDLHGFNNRIDTIQTAILGVKLPHLDAWNSNRRRLAQRYNRLLADLPIVTPGEAPWAEHVYHLYIIRTANRQALMDHLAGHGVACGLHYPIPPHKQKAMAHLGYAAGSFPLTERYADEILSLPMYPSMTGAAQDRVVEVMHQFDFKAQSSAPRTSEDLQPA